MALSGCATSIAYETNEGLKYLSKVDPPLELVIPGKGWGPLWYREGYWLGASIGVSTFRLQIDPQRQVSIFYRPLHHDNYRSILGPLEKHSVEELLEANCNCGYSPYPPGVPHFMADTEYPPNTKVNIVAKDIDGPILPNIVWSIEPSIIWPIEPSDVQSIGIAFNVAFIKAGVLITLTARYPYGAPANPDFIQNVFRSIRFMTEEQIDKAISAETTYDGSIIPDSPYVRVSQQARWADCMLHKLNQGSKP